MARLFVGQREVDFFADITKEVIKDVAGQKVFYYTIREDLSNVHEIYEESPQKVFNPPIEIEAMVEWQPSEIRTTNFGTETIKTITLYLHYRDLLDRGIVFKEGDYFSYGSFFFEATSIIYDKLIYGQIERVVSMKVNGKQTRMHQIAKRPNGPIDEIYTDEDAVQTTFEQQRGIPEHDVRRLQDDNIIEKPITGARKVSPDGTIKSINGIGSSFYGDE
tara:strand:- start:878 stop:1534 length:657 start_codon:yes stop_codon:yes gene_type:complete